MAGRPQAECLAGARPRLPRTIDSDREDAVRPIVHMQMPPLLTLRSFFSELLRSVECTVIIGSRISELEHERDGANGGSTQQLPKVAPIARVVMCYQPRLIENRSPTTLMRPTCGPSKWPGSKAFSAAQYSSTSRRNFADSDLFQ